MNGTRPRIPIGEPDLQYLRRRGNRRVRKVRLLRGLLRAWKPLLARVAPAALLVVLAIHGARQLGASRLFTLERIELDGTVRAAPDAVLAGIAPLVGRNLLQLDLDEAAARARENPWVRDAAVKRLLPHTLRVTVEERKPAARALVDASVLVVDETGAVLGPAGPGLPDDLPVLTGIEGTAGEARRVRLERGARAVLRLRAQVPTWLDEISELDLSRPDRIGVVSKAPGPALLLDPDEVGRNVRSYLALREEIGRRIGPLQTVDLRWRDRISVLPSDDEPMERD